MASGWVYESTPRWCPSSLRGRDRECEAIDELLEAVRDGDSRALPVRSEPGIGTTALLEYAVEEAGDLRVLRAVGFESETGLAFAALHHVVAPVPRPRAVPSASRCGSGSLSSEDAVSTARG